MRDEGTRQSEATATARTPPKQSADGQPMTEHRRRPTHDCTPPTANPRPLPPDLTKGRSDLGKRGRIHGSEGAAVREGGRSLRRKKGGGGGERATTRPVVRPAAGCHCHPTTTEAATARETLANGGTSRARGVAPESPLGDHARANLAFQVLQFHSSGMRLLILISCALTFFASA
jgi:hypothetical protein